MENEDIKKLIQIASKYKYYQWIQVVTEINRSFESKSGTTVLDSTDKDRLYKFLRKN